MTYFIDIDHWPFLHLTLTIDLIYFWLWPLTFSAFDIDHWPYLFLTLTIDLIYFLTLTIDLIYFWPWPLTFLHLTLTINLIYFWPWPLTLFLFDLDHLPFLYLALTIDLIYFWPWSRHETPKETEEAARLLWVTLVFYACVAGVVIFKFFPKLVSRLEMRVL